MAHQTPHYADFQIKDIDSVILPYELQGVSRMLRLHEMQLLYLLARDWVTTGDQIIDGGAFLGSSAAAMAAGLDARSDSAAWLKSLHSYDLFENSSDFYARFLNGTVEHGGSFLPHYLHNTAPYSKYINVYPGDFCKINWIGKPIGLLFVDISKTAALDAHIWSEFVPHMRPGHSIMVQQDFVHIRAPFVHVALGALIDHFDVLAISEPSLVLGYRSPIPAEKLLRARRLQCSATVFEQVEMIDVLIDRIAPLNHVKATASMYLLKALMFAEAGHYGHVQAILDDIDRDFGTINDPYYRARYQSVSTILASGAR